MSVYWFPSLCRIKSKLLKVVLKFFSLLLFFFFTLQGFAATYSPHLLSHGFLMVNVGTLSRGGGDDIDYLRHNLEVVQPCY